MTANNGINEEWKNFTPRKNPDDVATRREPAIEPLTEAQMEKLSNDSDALRNLAKTRLIEILHYSKPTTALVPAIKELLDRIDGKPAQTVAMTVKTDPASTLSDDQLASLLSMLPNPVIIPPKPKKLDVGN